MPKLMNRAPGLRCDQRTERTGAMAGLPGECPAQSLQPYQHERNGVQHRQP